MGCVCASILWLRREETRQKGFGYTGVGKFFAWGAFISDLSTRFVDFVRLYLDVTTCAAV
jgi:hypothetical protein